MRCSRTTCSSVAPAHDAVRGHRQSRRADAEPHLRLARYDAFTVKDGEQIFLACVADTQWTIFCEAFGFA